MNLSHAWKRFPLAALGLSLFALAGGWRGGQGGETGPTWFGPRAAHAQGMASMPCNDGEIDSMVAAINSYRGDSGSWVRTVSNGPANGMLIGSPEA